MKQQCTHRLIDHVSFSFLPAEHVRNVVINLHDIIVINDLLDNLLHCMCVLLACRSMVPHIILSVVEVCL